MKEWISVIAALAGACAGAIIAFVGQWLRYRWEHRDKKTERRVALAEELANLLLPLGEWSLKNVESSVDGITIPAPSTAFVSAFPSFGYRIDKARRSDAMSSDNLR